ncbi:FAD:protein FMN transferase [Fodinibius salsisoli]|uniref:FAD:protein FMN transferase n=1 Tax=Fodinibius salsisoli TaxID=2820877 RepID=A0ABT3PKC0_9BACT|nr:FAD:protein FMN transferase [Fodinibius salsisoli]MCW9706193.1 FAD:protein FMN transferase [Fodinibius salsisoli]
MDSKEIFPRAALVTEWSCLISTPNSYLQNELMNLRFNCLFVILSLLIIIPHPKAHAQSLQRYEFESRQMGTTFKLIFYAPNDSIANVAQESAFNRADTLNSILSDYDPKSNLNQLSSKSGTHQFFAVDSTLFLVLNKAQKLAKATDGAFDVTIGPAVSLWRKIRGADNPELPSSQELKQVKDRVGHQHLSIDRPSHSVALTQPGMQLDLGGIAKGFAADEMLRMLKEVGLHSVLVDAGGDIRLGDPPPGKKAWTVTIPAHKRDGSRKWLTLELSNCAIATSGDLFQHVMINGKRYSHIINPHTGLGLTDQSMVTVVAPDGITADSYASAISVLGVDKGMEFVNGKSAIMLRIEYKKNEDIDIRKSPGFDELIME